MALANLLATKPLAPVATAIIAIPAIPEGKNTENRPKIATIATIAIANPQTDPATHWQWSVNFGDGQTITAAFSPRASLADVLAQYPDAVSAKPIKSKPAGTLSRQLENRLVNALRAQGEDDPTIIAQAVALCASDPGALSYYLGSKP